MHPRSIFLHFSGRSHYHLSTHWWRPGWRITPEWRVDVSGSIADHRYLSWTASGVNYAGKKIASAPAMAERWQTLGVEPAGTAPAEFRAKFTAELEKWRKVVRAAHIELE